MNYMRTGLLAVCLGLLITACRSGNAHGVHNGSPVTDKKEVNDLVGTWYATPATYAMLAEKKYPGVRDSTIYIVLRKDSVFNAFHLPDCMDAANKGGLLLDAVGSWKLHQDENAWKLSMAFEKGKLFRYKTFTDFDIAIVDSLLTLSRYVGDPKEKDALQFRKNR
jgi:hypothetical protein